MAKHEYRAEPSTLYRAEPSTLYRAEATFRRPSIVYIGSGGATNQLFVFMTVSK